MALLTADILLSVMYVKSSKKVAIKCVSEESNISKSMLLYITCDFKYLLVTNLILNVVIIWQCNLL